MEQRSKADEGDSDSLPVHVSSQLTDQIGGEGLRIVSPSPVHRRDDRGCHDDRRLVIPSRLLFSSQQGGSEADEPDYVALVALRMVLDGVRYAGGV